MQTGTCCIAWHAKISLRLMTYASSRAASLGLSIIELTAIRCGILEISSTMNLHFEEVHEDEGMNDHRISADSQSAKSVFLKRGDLCHWHSLSFVPVSHIHKFRIGFCRSNLLPDSHRKSPPFICVRNYHMHDSREICFPRHVLCDEIWITREDSMKRFIHDRIWSLKFLSLAFTKSESFSVLQTVIERDFHMSQSMSTFTCKHGLSNYCLTTFRK